MVLAKDDVMTVRATLRFIQFALQAFSLALLSTLAAGALVYTILSALGIYPWLEIGARFGDEVLVNAGMYAQIAVTAILVSLAFFVPSVRRMLALENSHRNFQLRMEDVARAYHLSHMADRAGLFTLSSEFDSVRERLAYLRDHPDLAGLEADVLDVAAQMSHTSRHLAEVYSDEKVARAKQFLAQRQEEAEKQQDLIVQAHHACRDIRQWREQVELEESVVASQLARLEDELISVLPALGYELEDDGTNIVPLQKPAAE